MMEDWTDIIGEKLENIEEPLPADDWSVLQQKYAASKRNRKATFFAWAGGITSVAAAVALVLMVVRQDSSSCTPESDDNLNGIIAEALPPTDETVMTDTVLTESPVDTTAAATSPVQKRKTVPVSVIRPANDDALIAEKITGHSAEDKTEEVEFDVVRDTTSMNDRLIADASTTTAKEDRHQESAETSGFEDFQEDEPRKRRRPVSISLSGATSDNPIMKAYDYGISEPPMEDSTEPPFTHDGSHKDSLDMETPQPAMRMMRSKGGYTDSYNHEIPVSIGLSARLHLTDRLSVNTGLNYTRYKSTRIRKFIDTSERQTDKQHVHYLGVPVRLDYMAVSRKHFNFYLGAGMQIDKCIYATVGSERLSEKQVLFGVNGTMGLQVNIVPMMGLYFEPEVYYALNEGSIETFRSDEPFVITVRGGLRFNF